MSYVGAVVGFVCDTVVAYEVCATVERFMWVVFFLFLVLRQQHKEKVKPRR